MLKMEIERIQTPEGKPPPRWPQKKIIGWFGALLVFLMLGGGAVFAFWSLQTPRDAVAFVQPTPVGTLPTPAPMATQRPILSNPNGQGTLLVRLAEGQQINRSVNNLAIILDASGSMLQKVDGQRKIDIAHDSLVSLVDRLPETTNVALRTYGHRRSGDCSDIELITPLEPLNQVEFVNEIRSIEPVNLGRTPMALSLEEVAKDLSNTDSDTLVVLVSDGDETCGGDPAQAAAALRAANPRVKVSVIGFNIGPQEWRDRLVAIAQNGGGNYFEANNASQLAEALRQAIIPTYRILDAAGLEVFAGNLGVGQTLPIGRYAIEITGTAPFKLNDIEIDDSVTTVVELQEQNGVLDAAIRTTNNQP